MSQDLLTAIGVVRAKPHQEEELGRRMAALLEPTRSEPVCIAYDLFQSIEDPAIWVVLEQWRSVEDLDAHVVTEHMTSFLAHSDEVIAHPPKNFRLKQVGPAANRRDNII